MERAGIDIVTDGEIRRESYSNRFATALEGIDAENPAMITARSGQKTPVPRVVGKIGRKGAVELRDMEFLRRNTDRAAKITLPGPFTMSQQAKDEFYNDDEALAMALAAAVNAEALELQKAGADVIQLDEPWVRNDPAAAKRYAVKAINRALQGITVPTVVHICFGYAAVVPGDTKPSGYSFLAELADSSAEQISIEAAQPKLDLGVLADLSAQKDHARRDRSRQSRDRDRGRDRRAHPPRPQIRLRRPADPGAGLRHEIHAAPDRLRQAQGDERRGGDRAEGDRVAPCRPGEGRDPYAVKFLGTAVLVASLRRASQQRTFGVMGPGLRRDDVEYEARLRPNRPSLRAQRSNPWRGKRRGGLLRRKRSSQ